MEKFGNDELSHPTVMNSWPTLTRAPIVEGLIDIRVDRAPGISLAELKSACDQLAEEFPSRQERRMWMGEFTLSPGAGTSVSSMVQEPDGIILRTADEKWVAQFRMDGFTLSRLNPYTSWGDLRAKALELWSRYQAAAKPRRVVRVASRFINRVALPPGSPFEKTFATTFLLAPELPQAVAGYLLRVIIPFEPEHAMAIVTQSLDPSGSECIFDLDAYSERAEGLTEGEIWQRLDMLRDIKNRVFFGSLTAEALERFK